MKPLEFETFRPLGFGDQISFLQKEPSAFNEMIRVIKYRITVEPIEEPVEVYRERLRELWRKNTNHYNCRPLVEAGKKYGIDLTKED